MSTIQDYLRKNPKRHLIFDFDYTIAKMIIDWSGWHKVVSEVYQLFEPSYHQAGKVHLVFNDFVERYGKRVAMMVDEVSREYEKGHLQELVANQDLVDFIKQEKTMKMSVYSSNSRPTVESGLEQLGITNCFDKLVTRSDVSFIKPHPEGFYLLHDFELEKSDYLMIGDSVFDEELSKSVGIDFFQVEF